ncbi:MAG: ABC transporter substrate binding protein [Candidatus Auribacterota bacterium]
MRRFAVALSLFLALSAISAATVCAEGKVLVVHSYHEGYAWVDQINEGVKKSLDGTGIELEIFYMDTKRKSDDAWKKEASELAIRKVAEYDPDVVITSDDNAQGQFVQAFIGKDRPQFVFCGVNAEASKYGFPASNVTGILERPHFVQTMDMLKQIIPSVQKVAIITDASNTSTGFLDDMKSKTDIPVEIIEWKQTDSFQEWQDAVKKFQSTADAIGVVMYHTIKESPDSPQSMDPKQVIEWTLANNTKPLVGFLEFTIEDGLLCGITEFGEEHGFESGKIAREMILNGKTAADFPIKTAEKGIVVVNVKAAEKMNIDLPYEVIEASDRVIE